MAVISNGTTIFDAGAIDSGQATGNMTLIKDITLSSAAGTISFLNGASNVVFDGTYDSYVFKFINIHLATNGQNFTFQADTGTNTSYNQTITSTSFTAYHGENGNSGTLSYGASGDQAQGSAFQSLCEDLGNDADQSYCGELQIFSPSSTVFVKHFMATGNEAYHSDYSNNATVAGYLNTTSAITGLQFKMESGNIDAGIIKLYGIK